MELRYPSDVFPGPPGICLTLPDGWEPFASPTAVVCAADPGSPDHFRANVVVIMGKVVHEYSARDLAEVLAGKTADEYGDAEVLASEEVVVAGHAAVLATLGFRPADAPFAVAQVQGVVLVPTTDVAVRYAVQFHGTCARDGLGRYEPIFRRCFMSLAVG